MPNPEKDLTPQEASERSAARHSLHKERVEKFNHYDQQATEAAIRLANVDRDIMSSLELDPAERKPVVEKLWQEKDDAEALMPAAAASAYKTKGEIESHLANDREFAEANSGALRDAAIAQAKSELVDLKLDDETASQIPHDTQES